MHKHILSTVNALCIHTHTVLQNSLHYIVGTVLHFPNAKGYSHALRLSSVIMLLMHHNHVTHTSTTLHWVTVSLTSHDLNMF